MLAYYSNPENVEKVRRLKNEHYAAHPETKKKLSVTIKAKLANDLAYRERMFSAKRAAIENDPTYRARISATLKEKYRQHPELAEISRRREMKRFAGNPAESRKTSAAVRAAFASDPEYREKHSNKMLAYYEQGNKPQTTPRACLCVETGVIYRSLTAAEKDVGVDHACISRCCKGKRHTAGGYTWRYAEK